MILPVNEIFDTIQGEAYYTGMPSTFVRMQGCPVGCPWCDTKHTWVTKPEMEVSLEGLLQKKRDGDSYAMLSVEQIVRLCHQGHVVLTGGEPCMYDLTELTDAILDEGKSVQIETSGTFEIKCSPGTWVTVSPKINMPGGLKVLNSAYRRSNELKYPVGKQADVDRLIVLLAKHRRDCFEDKGGWGIVWLQPLSQSPKATALCIKAASEHRWRVSCQTHKYLGVR